MSGEELANRANAEGARSCELGAGTAGAGPLGAGAAELGAGALGAGTESARDCGLDSGAESAGAAGTGPLGAGAAGMRDCGLDSGAESARHTEGIGDSKARQLEERFLEALQALRDCRRAAGKSEGVGCAATERTIPAGPFLLMVSGGSDSTALARLAARTIPADALGILHVNHQLRGDASDEDEAFVRALADELDIDFYCARCDIATMAADEGGNVEAIGRRERYAAAQEALADMCASAASRTGAGAGDAPSTSLTDGATGFILTAHTRDDRIENFFMRSIVGTGPGGFRGMDRANGSVLHPLLDFSREELRDYLHACACTSAAAGRVEGAELWREDATNATADRFRTFVRHRIVPAAKEQNPRLGETLSRSMDLIADENAFLEELAATLMRTHVEWLNPRGADWFAERAGGFLPDTQLTVVCEGAEPEPDYSAGCVLSPRFTDEPLVLKRRVIHAVLRNMLDDDARVETASVDAVLEVLGQSGAVRNIQGDLAVSTNKHGTRIEPMEAYRARRRRL